MQIKHLKYLCGLLAIVLAILIYPSLSGRKKVLNYPNEAYLPLIRVGFESELLNNSTNNYWIQGSYLLKNFVYGENITESVKLLDSIMNVYKENGCFPRNEHDDLAYGWVSSMDAPVIALACFVLKEKEYGGGVSERAEDYLNLLLPYLEKSVQDNGFILREHNLVWPLEYAHINSNSENAKFVLNGSLVGILSMYILGEELKDESLKDLAISSINTYKDMSEKYIYSDQYWSYYMLNPLNTNAPHYLIFEIQLLDALYLVSNDSFFVKQAELRRNMFSQILKLEAKPLDNGNLNVNMLRACAPDPYIIDINETMIKFYDKDQKIVQTVFKNGRNLKEDGWLECEIPASVVGGKIYSIARNTKGEIEWETMICDTKIEILETPALEDDVIVYECLTSLDGKNIDESTVIIDPYLSDKEYVRLYFKLIREYEKNINDYWAYEINNLSDYPLNLKLILYDSDNQTSSRYYMPLKSGKNLVLWNISGFANESNIKNLANLGIYIYTENLHEKVQIELGNVYRFSKNIELRNYEQKSDYLR